MGQGNNRKRKLNSGSFKEETQILWSRDQNKVETKAREEKHNLNSKEKKKEEKAKNVKGALQGDVKYLLSFGGKQES